MKRTTLASYVGQPPYLDTGVRMKSGMKLTAFHPVFGKKVKEWKLHNTYLKPDQITDPMQEYEAMREVAGLWDVTGEEAIEVRGPDALKLMEELVPRRLERLADGHCLHALMCYDYGGIVEDAVLIRFEESHWWWVGGPGWAEQWLYAHSRARNVEIRSLLDEVHVASIQGPRSRDILQGVCDGDLQGLPYFGATQAKVCGVPVTISRTGFTGELGFDVYVKVDEGEAMFRGLWEAGRDQGMKLCGSRALNMRRTEASILNFGQDFDWTHNPYEIGLERLVDMDKPFFHGKDILQVIAARGPTRKVVGMEASCDEALEHGSLVHHKRKPVGVVSSALLSPALDKSIAIATVAVQASEIGTRLSVRQGKRRVEARVVAMPFFDPERKLSHDPPTVED